MKYLLIFLMTFFLSGESEARGGNRMDHRVKSVMIMSIYGAAGGGLLGLASMAFGAKGHWVARGASLGLYSGIVFGSYVVLSHTLKTQRSPHDDDRAFDDFSDLGPRTQGIEGFAFPLVSIRF